jgi:hypothetical protein
MVSPHFWLGSLGMERGLVIILYAAIAWTGTEHAATLTAPDLTSSRTSQQYQPLLACGPTPAAWAVLV